MAIICATFFAFWRRTLHKVMPSCSFITFLTHFATVIIGVTLVPILQLVCHGSPGNLLCPSVSYDSLASLVLPKSGSTLLPLFPLVHQALPQSTLCLTTQEGPTQGTNGLLPLLMMAGGGQVGWSCNPLQRPRTRQACSTESIPVGMLWHYGALWAAVTSASGKPFITACLARCWLRSCYLFHLGTAPRCSRPLWSADCPAW